MTSNGILRHALVIHDPIDAHHLASRVRVVQQRQEVPKQPVVFTRTKAIETTGLRHDVAGWSRGHHYDGYCETKDDRTTH